MPINSSQASSNLCLSKARLNASRVHWTRPAAVTEIDCSELDSPPGAGTSVPTTYNKGGEFGAEFTKSVLSRFAQYGSAIRNGSFIESRLGVIGTSHAGVEVDFLITSQDTCANKRACFVHCDRGRFTAPWKWAEMITAQQDLIIGESSVPRHGTDKTGKLLRILSRIAAELIYLAGS